MLSGFSEEKGLLQRLHQGLEALQGRLLGQPSCTAAARAGFTVGSAGLTSPPHTLHGFHITTDNLGDKKTPAPVSEFAQQNLRRSGREGSAINALR